MRRLIPILVVLAQPAVLAHADHHQGRVRLAEGGVALQRASEMETEEAVPNLPFLPGDRVWTDEGGRAEFQFADGTFLRVDRRTKLDYSSYEDRILLRLWSGTLALHVGDRAESYAISLPGGTFEARRAGAYRIDLDQSETRVSVCDGEAVFEGDRRIRIRAGERVRIGWEETGRPERFDCDESDEFAQWDAERERGERWSGTLPEDLPEEVVPYAGDLSPYGAWSYEAEIGNIWRPYVDPGWRPYWSGRWVWTVYGWTWVPSEPWGWAPFHYGRWGFSAHLGWYWIPGNSWGPAWVSWALGSDSVGWCALDRHNRPVLLFERSYRGQAVPRHAASGVSAWTFVRHRELASRDLARRRLEPTASLLGSTRILESAHASLTRDLRVTQVERAVPRNIRTKPSPGDTVPELRTDPMTTIPHAIRRHPESGRPERRNEDASSAARPRERRGGTGDETREAPPRTDPVNVIPHAVPRRHPESGRPERVDPPAAGPARERRAPRSEPREEVPARPHDSGRQPSWRPAREANPREADPGRDRSPHGSAVGRERAEPDRQREVLRPLFEPVSRGRQRDEGSSARPRSEAPPRSSPRSEAPPPSSPRSDGEHGARRRDKDKND
jgi:hypothetical protein